MQNKMIRVKPIEGTKVRKPDGTILSSNGELVDRGPFWIRRIKGGDVVEVVKKENAPVDALDAKPSKRKSEKT